MFNLFQLSRGQAAGAHFTISTTIALSACAMIYFVWYPGPFFTAIGGLGLLSLIVGVDICLGPLLTLVVFNPEKNRKLLILDLTLIVLLQFSALWYGVSATYNARPVFVVYHESQFVVLIESDIEPEWYEGVQDEQFKSPSLWGPKWVAVRAPSEMERADYNAFETLGKSTGIGVQGQPKYYVDLEKATEDIKKSARDIKILREIKPNLSSSYGDNVGFITMDSKQQNLYVLIDKTSGKILDVID